MEAPIHESEHSFCADSVFCAIIACFSGAYHLACTNIYIPVSGFDGI
jgi:hypothetical protein